MSYFAVHYTYSTDAAALDALRPKHREFLGSLTAGPLVASGPYLDADVASALLILTGESTAEIAGILDEDPFWVNSLITERRITAWNPVIGVFAS